MKYISTRGQSSPLTFSQAVAEGLAPDGGLFMPENLPDLSPYFFEWQNLPFTRLCTEFFKIFASDMDADKIAQIVEKSYKDFDDEKIAPVFQLDKNLYIMELFHGPTLAFKDFALQLLGNLYEEQILTTGKPINVLGATSGDTGSAAISGLLGKKGVNIFILYPNGKVSKLQEKQMTTTGASNVFPIAIEGTFDDAQKIVKSIFADTALKNEKHLSAVNSINIARILAQCVYYLFAYFQIPEEKRQNIQFVVPTGNFGNVFAGFLCSKMGMKVNSFKVATNQNDILYKFFTSGDYSLGEVFASYAPSMDIQVASNFERFLYLLLDRNSEKLRALMQEFSKYKSIKIDEFKNENLCASSMQDKQILKTIRLVYEKFKYIVDPHTACAFKDLDKEKCSVIISTAHPAKFPVVIKNATGIDSVAYKLELLKNLPIKNVLLPADEEAIKQYLLSNI